MTPNPYCVVEGNVSTIGFEDALWRLKDLLGRQVQVLANFRGTFGSCSLQGELTRVETSPPDNTPPST